MDGTTPSQDQSCQIQILNFESFQNPAKFTKSSEDDFLNEILKEKGKKQANLAANDQIKPASAQSTQKQVPKPSYAVKAANVVPLEIPKASKEGPDKEALCNSMLESLKLQYKGVDPTQLKQTLTLMLSLPQE